MARPRKNQEGPSATERMERAFWEALRAKPYANITVSDVVRGAGVNRNAFYYHYRDLDDMAHAVVGNMLLVEVPPLIVRGFEAGENPLPSVFEALFADSESAARIEHVGLIVGSHGSPMLVRMIKDAIKGLWCESFGFDAARLSDEADIILEFYLGGALALLERFGADSFGAEMRAFVQSDFMRAAVSLLPDIMRREAARMA